jgi:hypothetical protein
VRFASSSGLSARLFMHVCDRCDERFTGYGGNKAACLFEMYLSGVSFYVLSDHFLVHQSHTYEEEARKNEVSTRFPLNRALYRSHRPKQRRYNRKIHSDFKEETCLRFFTSFRGWCRVLMRNAKVSQAFFRPGSSQHDARAQCPRGVQEN